MKKKYTFFILIILYLLLSILSKYILNTEKLIVNNLSDFLTQNQIDTIIDNRKSWSWLSYALLPLLLLLKVSIIASILDVGCFFFEKEIKYKRLFNIVTQAEFVFILVIIFKTTWFYSFQTNYTLEDLQTFYPLSALNIVGSQGLKTWFIYPFQVLNLFEVAYWFVLAYLIGKEINDTTEKGLSIVASSYGVGLLIWVVGVMFLTLNMS
tara:strand:- start:911 stop:1537 length:627 start_codon:yes stop_codon:yes gene_type:complete